MRKITHNQLRPALIPGEQAQNPLARLSSKHDQRVIACHQGLGKAQFDLLRSRLAEPDGDRVALVPDLDHRMGSQPTLSLVAQDASSRDPTGAWSAASHLEADLVECAY